MFITLYSTKNESRNCKQITILNRSAPQVFLVSDDDMVEHSAGDSPAFANVLIAAVSHPGDDADFLGCLYIFQEILYRAVAGWVVGKIYHHLEIFKLKNV